MQSLEYILCHGSGNKFVMIDTIAHPLNELFHSSFVQELCHNFSSDGVLYLTRYDAEHLAMRMFNTDGSEAEMCGNGIRCIARLSDERYLHSASFTLYSGGKPYPILREEPISEGVATYSVDIAIKESSADFALNTAPFVGKVIEPLDEKLRFTYLNLGNPHIVAECEEINLEHLSALGERVKELKDIFPNGVNVSLFKRLGEQQIFVATYERGVGLTASCGTAMTASSTASVMLGICKEDKPIDVRNRGGAVKCTTRLKPNIVTRLAGNATYIAEGEVSASATILTQNAIEAETIAWSKLIEKL